MEAIIRTVVMAILRGGAAETIDPSSNRLATATLWAVVSAVLAVAGIGCAAAGLWMWLASALGPVVASLTVAGVLVVASLGALAAMRHSLAPTKPPPSAKDRLEGLAVEALRIFKEHKGPVLLAAVIAGLATEHRDRKNDGPA